MPMLLVSSQEYLTQRIPYRRGSDGAEVILFDRPSCHTVEQTGLRKTEDVTADLQKSIIKKNIMQLDTFTAGIRTNMNPFTEDLDRNLLFNISTGQAATENITNFLLDVEKMGNKQREDFIKECVEDHSRFEKPIKRNKVHTFTDAI